MFPLHGQHSKFSVTKTGQSQISDHDEPHRFASAVPIKDDIGPDSIPRSCAYVPLGTPGDVTVDGVDPAHASSSRARSRRGHAAGRPVGAYD